MTTEASAAPAAPATSTLTATRVESWARGALGVSRGPCWGADFNACVDRAIAPSFGIEERFGFSLSFLQLGFFGFFFFLLGNCFVDFWLAGDGFVDSPFDNERLCSLALVYNLYGLARRRDFPCRRLTAVSGFSRFFFQFLFFEFVFLDMFVVAEEIGFFLFDLLFHHASRRGGGGWTLIGVLGHGRLLVLVAGCVDFRRFNGSP